MALQAVGLTTHILNNNIRSTLLLFGFPALLLGMLWAFFTALQMSGVLTYGEAIPGTESFSRSAGVGLQAVRDYGVWVLAATAGWFAVAWAFHTRMVRAAVGSKPVTRKEYPRLYNLLENLCISRGLPMPTFEIIDTPALNAFASGISDKTYTITLTRGLIERLEDDEIEAVLAHELTHIINRDVRLMIVAVIFVGMISFLAEVAYRSLLYGGRTARVRYRGKSNGRQGGVLLIALIVLMAGYICALLIRFALSRRREYLADAGAVELTKNPEAMMRALLRISGKDQITDMPADFKQMCIENSQKFLGLMATHPPIEERVSTISALTGTPVPKLGISLKRPPRRPWDRGHPPENADKGIIRRRTPDALNENLHPTLRHPQGRTEGPWGRG